MKIRFISLVAIIAVILGCHKDSNTPITQALEGTWKYIGHSEGIGGFRFTPANEELYIQFKGTAYLENTNTNNQFCGSYSFTKDPNSTYDHLGLITFDTTVFGYSNQYDAYRFHDTLMLYPHNFNDVYESYYIPSSKQFSSCATAQP